MAKKYILNFQWEEDEIHKYRFYEHDINYITETVWEISDTKEEFEDYLKMYDIKYKYLGIVE